MDIRVLKYYLVIAREENITKAAQLLHVTQPTLSRQMMQLEKELDIKLFTRSNHHIILTDDGMLLRRRAQELVTLADKTVAEFAQSEEVINGEIFVGCGESRSMDVFAEIIEMFRGEYPLVHFDFHSGNANNIKERMERGIIDIALLMEPVDIAKYEFVRLPFKETWGILVDEDAPLAQQESVVPKDLVGVPLICSKRGLVRSELDNWFGAYAEQMEVVATYNLLYNSAILAKHHVGAVLCFQLDSQYPGLKFVPLSPKLETGSVIAWNKSQTFSRATVAFINFLKKYANRMPDDEM